MKNGKQADSLSLYVLHFAFLISKIAALKLTVLL